jgi:hypothetical protein
LAALAPGWLLIAGFGLSLQSGARPAHSLYFAMHNPRRIAQ